MEGQTNCDSGLRCRRDDDRVRRESLNGHYLDSLDIPCVFSNSSVIQLLIKLVLTRFQGLPTLLSKSCMPTQVYTCWICLEAYNVTYSMFPCSAICGSPLGYSIGEQSTVTLNPTSEYLAGCNGCSEYASGKTALLLFILRLRFAAVANSSSLTRRESPLQNTSFCI